MHAIELVLSLFIAVAGLAYLAGRLRLPYPIFLVLGGLALGFIPNLPRVMLDPDLVFLLFLPPILYHAALMTSWRDFKANIRPIGLLAFGLVLFTMALVGVAAHYWAEMSWGAAFVLGAIVSPPDAVAATAIMSQMRIPTRIIVVLEGESLVNDATALVAYRLAVAGVVAGTAFSASSMGYGAWQFFYVAVGGIGVGLLVGIAVAWVRKHLSDDGIEGIVSLLTPYIAYLPAEHLGVSGVLSAVAAGIYISRKLPTITASHTRLKLYAVWDTFIFLLNGLVFMLIGLQLPVVLGRIRDGNLRHVVGEALLISGIVIALRILWVFPATYWPRRLFKSIAARDPAPPAGQVFVVAWTGLRGIVSLAAALALPVTLADRVTPFPHRDYIIFVTFVVILVTLVVQGLTLPGILKWLKLGDDGIEEREETRARFESVHAAISRLDALVLLGEARPEAIESVRSHLAHQAKYLSSRLGDTEGLDQVEVVCETEIQAEREALAAQQQMILKLRDDGVIGDEVLRRIQAELDHEESRLELA